jgi:hypothetical protein
MFADLLRASAALLHDVSERVQNVRHDEPAPRSLWRSETALDATVGDEGFPLPYSFAHHVHARLTTLLPNASKHSRGVHSPASRGSSAPSTASSVHYKRLSSFTHGKLDTMMAPYTEIEQAQKGRLPAPWGACRVGYDSGNELHARRVGLAGPDYWYRAAKTGGS